MLGALVVAVVVAVGGAVTRAFAFTFFVAFVIVVFITLNYVQDGITTLRDLQDGLISSRDADRLVVPNVYTWVIAIVGLSGLLRVVLHGWQRLPLAYVPAMIMICLSLAWVLSALDIWRVIGPLLLLFGLLTLINAPFDWASLGLTRALLHRGLELGGWWPYALALADACLAAAIIAALALTMVLGVQAFDALAILGGGTPVLPLDALFDGIAKSPAAPEYWWIYALLLSTMIPSLVNLVIGGTSLLRGLPGLSALLLRYIPVRGGVLKWDRAWIATVLTAQVAVGAALGIAAQAFLALVIIRYILPWLGLDVLLSAQKVAAFNLPARVGQLFGISL